VREAPAELRADDDRVTAVTGLGVLLEVQNCDTQLSQLAHRLAHLVERDLLVEAKTKLLTLQKQMSDLQQQAETAKAEVGAIEALNKKHDAMIAKYSQQLKTVIAPREAEALQHEIEMAQSERSQNDDRELALLETIEKLDGQITVLRLEIERHKSSVGEATNAFEAVANLCQVEKQNIETNRAGIVAKIDTKLVRLYEAKRAKRTTPAVARLNGTKCQSCHLDLSVVELGALKKLGADEFAECPNCDCYLVV